MSSMKLLIIAAASLAVVSCASLSLEDLEFHAWKLKFGKVYRTPEEEAQRKDIWLSTRRRVLTHNILADQGIKTYRMGMNHFSDMTREEHHNTVLLRSTILSNETKATRQRGASPSRQTGGTKLPSSFDWRKMGCVTGVKNQGPCGSCWAFSTTGALESHTCIKHGRLPSLSEQQLVDCSGSYGTKGCHGGWMYDAFNYIQANGGIDTEDAYPYEGQDLPCRFKPSGVGATCTGYVTVTPGDELSLQDTVASVGPVAVAIDVYNDFWAYESGVYNEPSCKETNLLHAMLVVGYGTQDGQDYWLVKNSWDSSWGEEGYIKMSRNKANQCDIASYAFYPQV
ncbi:procathepsin L-like isoform X1 [Alosa sapidissima]|uniref:procathepsin L-like isoform X1 n=2 Tax=Alosa sapidissima TaxID=34773 RepID=UPI001C07F6B0|nr:procathepsin L-like isoform X1 [Alosa sapidissima]XP_041964370.1 procathepsin L-like isoform X1 [Alosa sapidissima]